jgi:hypothetical protein
MEIMNELKGWQKKSMMEADKTDSFQAKEQIRKN